MIGIYKITSPSNRIYIGQSIDINKRFYNYLLKHCKSQTKLLHSFNKYNVKNHIFEILEECEESQLNNKERYWQDYYESNTQKGLNCRLTKTDDKSGKLSEKTKLKMINARKLNINSNSSKSKKVVDNSTGIIYNSVAEIARLFSLSASNLSRKLKGTRKNNTNYDYYIEECYNIIDKLK